MSEIWTLTCIKVGMPSINTSKDRTTVRVTAQARMVQEDRPRSPFGRQEIKGGGFDEALDATVVLMDDDDFPGERLEASDVKSLVTRAIDRAIVEAGEAATALIEAMAAEPPAPTFDAGALRAAYRLGYDCGSYDNGGDPAGDSVDSYPFRFAEAHDLKAYLGEAAADAALDAFLGRAATPPAMPESASA